MNLWSNASILLKRVLLNRAFLYSVIGFLVAVFIYCCVQDRYEKQLFSALAEYTKKDLPQDVGDREDSLIIRSLHLVNFLEKGRSQIFSGKIESELNSGLISSIADDLITARGSCGSYSIVLARLLRQMNIPVRIAQMQVGNEFGGHILLEAKSAHGWVVLDPLYDLFFKAPDGRLASFAEVHADWSWYSKQLPSQYNAKYRYDNVRYTNWNKVPVIMPLIKSTLNVIVGEEAANEVSLRNIFLRKFLFLAILALAINIVICTFLLWTYWKLGTDRIRSRSFQRSIVVPTGKIAV